MQPPFDIVREAHVVTVRIGLAAEEVDEAPVCHGDNGRRKQAAATFEDVR
jgi:hypothetical protein